MSRKIKWSPGGDIHTNNNRSGARDVESAFRPSGVLLQAGTTLGRAIEQHAVLHTDVNATTLDLLVRLNLSPGRQLRGVDLCRQLLKSPGYVSRLVDRAEADGLVTRNPDPDDRRAQLIVLTTAGDAVLDTFVPHAIEVLEHTVYAALSTNEIEILINLLTRITRTTEAYLET